MKREEQGIVLGETKRDRYGNMIPGFYVPYSILERGGGRVGKEFVEELRRGDYDDGKKNAEPIIKAIIHRWLGRRHE